MAFNLLPAELNIQICGYLQSDSDVASFVAICRATKDAILCDRSSFWRVQFAKHYELFSQVDTKSLRTIFQNRRKTLRRGASFTSGKSEEEQRCLQVLRDLMLESYLGRNHAASDHTSQPTSLNVDSIKAFILNHDFLHKICSPRLVSTGVHPTLATIQVILSSFLLNGQYKFDCLGFPDCQRAVYQTPRKAPLFRGTEKVAVNSFLLLQFINFFRYHLTERSGALAAEYINFPLLARPRVWEAPILNGSYRLGRKWKGTYSYLLYTDMLKLRQNTGQAAMNTIDDLWSDDNGGFQNMHLSFERTLQIKQWPDLLEENLQSLTHPSYLRMLKEYEKLGAKNSSFSPRCTRAQSFAGTTSTCEAKSGLTSEDKRNMSPLSFRGVLSDRSLKYCTLGWLTPSPPQSKICGWMRFTMLRIYLEDYPDYDIDTMEPMSAILQHVDEQTFWAYEGVVIPGGQVIVGRWWNADTQDRAGPEGTDETYSGPFIFWHAKDESDDE